MSNNNLANRSPALKCKGCGSDAGLVAVEAQYVTRLYNFPFVIISFNCKQGDCGTPVQLTYECSGREGVRVKEGYPDHCTSAQKHPLQLPPLLISEVNAIKDGTNWSAYREFWAHKFVEELQNVKPEEVLRKFVSVDIVLQGTARILRRIVLQGTGRVLCRNVQLDYDVYKYLSNNDVTVSQMIVDAFEQSRLKKEDYECHRVAQRKELADGSIDDVEANLNDPIQHGAFYTVVVVKKY